MEPLREWFCKGADMTFPAEYEAALCQLEDDPPDIRQHDVNIAIKEMNLNTEVRKTSLEEVLEFQGPRMDCTEEYTPHPELEHTRQPMREAR